MALESVREEGLSTLSPVKERRLDFRLKVETSACNTETLRRRSNTISSRAFARSWEVMGRIPRAALISLWGEAGCILYKDDNMGWLLDILAHTRKAKKQ